MRTGRPSTSSWVLLTGATGFVGQCLLGELLERGHRVLAIVRAERPAEARDRLAEAMKPWGRDIEPGFEAGNLAVVRGNLHLPSLGLSRDVQKRLRGSVDAVIHAAGSTTFRARPDGEPMRTNVEGTREVFRLARACECLNWHLISTAFVCGKTSSSVETLVADPPEFRNAYEQSKWLTEDESARAAAESGAALTVYRPSIVVGHSESGVATRFVGAYYLFRATSLITQATKEHADVDRLRIPLRICANADSCANMVFANDMARDFADLFARGDAHGGVYHLTHPTSPSNQQIKDAVESYYGIAGGRFIGGGQRLPAQDRTPFEEIIAGMTDGISSYLFDSPTFDRSRAAAFVSQPPAAWTEQRLHLLIRYAESVGWRPAGRDRDPRAELVGFSAYFEQFLPTNAARSRISRIGQLDVDVRFRIDKGIDGDWWCRFRNGKVADVRRSGESPADVTFRTTPAAFWRAVAGEVTGAELFLSGDARIEGDIERGLKLAMILEQFVREFPCDREWLLADDTSAV